MPYELSLFMWEFSSDSLAISLLGKLNCKFILCTFRLYNNINNRAYYNDIWNCWFLGNFQGAICTILECSIAPIPTTTWYLKAFCILITLGCWACTGTILSTLRNISNNQGCHEGIPIGLVTISTLSILILYSLCTCLYKEMFLGGQDSNPQSED